MAGERPRRVAVLGASGHTGSFVVDELRARGFMTRAVGRAASRLESARWATSEVERRVASVDDPASLGEALAGVDAVINCAGPFLDTADAVIAASLRSGAHYLDVSAEQASTLRALEAFDAPARDAGVVVVPAMGFFGGLADLLVAAAAPHAVLIDEVTVAIALDSWHPTEGTRRTGARNTAPRTVVRDGRLVPLASPASRERWVFPEPFGEQEVVEIALSEVTLLAHRLRLGRSVTLLNDRPMRDLADQNTPPPVAVDDRGRSAQRFVVEVEVRCGAETARARVGGRDIYAVTAPLVVGAVEQVLAGAGQGGGASAPGEILDAGSLLRSLAPRHLAVDIEPAHDSGA